VDSFDCGKHLKGGSFYLQSKVVRAKECVDYDFEQRGLTPLHPKPPEPPSEEKPKDDGAKAKEMK